MKRFFTKPFRWAAVYGVLLTACFGYTLLDTFVIPKPVTAVSATVATRAASVSTGSAAKASTTGTAAIVTGNSYDDGNVRIAIETVRKYNSTLYVADIQVSDASYLQTALAGNTFGRNIKATTSATAKANNAIFAINGDYYGFRNAGYVVRNGVTYRNTPRTSGEDADLVIDHAGNFSIIHERQTTLESLGSSISQVLSFGPSLIENGKITVTGSSEVSQSMTSNPRTAIGQVGTNHYVVIVSDGRTSESQGLSLLQLAQEMQARGCVTAYNLDGGGSSAMYFNGNIVNKPTDGRSIAEREVSDIVWLGD